MNREHRSKQCRPRLEDLEPREMPSTVPSVGSAPKPAASAAQVASPSSTPAGLPPWVKPSILQQTAQTLYGPITTTSDTTVGGTTFPPGTYTVPQPTPGELARQTFWMQFVGHYYVGAPRFSNQSATIHIYSNGRNVQSNQSSHSRAQLLLLPPADPSASPTPNDPMAGQVAGLLSMFPANALQSGSSFFADAHNLPDVPSNDPNFLDHGLPAHMQFILEPNGITAGIYSYPTYTVYTPGVGESATTTGGNGGAVSVQGAGEIDIQYIPNNHLRGRAAQSGTAIVRVQGLLNLTGVTNPLYKGIN